MAVIEQATLRPSKAEALAAWLPDQAWSGVVAGAPLQVVGQFRFDDPAGEVGVEVLLARTEDGRVLQAPLTYRDAPLPGADAFLVTEMDHSVLGRRWVYDAVGDPVHADVLRRAIVTGGHEAELELANDAGRRPKDAWASGSGSEPDSPDVTSVHATTTGAVTSIATDHGTIVIARVVGTALPEGEKLTGTWTDGSGVLAVLLPERA
ncbi:hypothetical protein EDF31_10445 [Curtobacterium sp. PhB142]|uniref:CG0192-related protein n=1 Tax=unclassified Curtobacterium TaxID=257496 RepID=UPI0010494831|nr:MULTISPECIES: hypothetical protein [unclassified Curtobacterium]TCL86150.1 hypothetical protein EDF31_10445 [Curtobacterium sp. PhB142]TCM02340.1 hypothetical protein EDF26_10445 [Curtobacterium sp. PhB134]TCU49906.1 hypothetical protein EDF33_101400 [Curtobacterium sp. PhB146]